MIQDLKEDSARWEQHLRASNASREQNRVLGASQDYASWRDHAYGTMPEVSSSVLLDSLALMREPGDMGQPPNPPNMAAQALGAETSSDLGSPSGSSPAPAIDSGYESLPQDAAKALLQPIMENPPGDDGNKNIGDSFGYDAVTVYSAPPSISEGLQEA